MTCVLTFDAMMLLTCTVMLYTALPTVLVATDPAFLEVRDTTQ